MLTNQKILIIGGSGSLGHKLTSEYINTNQIYIYSRDESKHWNMSLEFNKHSNLNFIIGNINDENKITQTLLRYNFNIIILAAAMKHIEKCETAPDECISTNLVGTQSLLNSVENNKHLLTNLNTICYISTDKACNPISTYGLSKALSERLIIEKSRHLLNIKLVIVRYGNILNSNGSILQILHKIGKIPEIEHYTLTDENMTRFLMTLQQSVKLIEYAITNGQTGDIIIPKLKSCYIKDIFDIFSNLYNKPVKIDGIRLGEKLVESLINETEQMRLFNTGDYLTIKCDNEIDNNDNKIEKEYNSNTNLINKQQLIEYLDNLGLLNINTKLIFSAY